MILVIYAKSGHFLHQQIYIPKSFERSCITAKFFERFRISQYISKYFEVYFERFQGRNILKIVSKYFESRFEIFFEIFCNRNNSKYFRTGWIGWISRSVIWVMTRTHWTIFEILRNVV